RELAQLNGFLDKALAGHGTVCFVTGEAGAGKTALVTEFARRAQDEHDDLLVAIGDCNAQTGIGDPYLPFREVLGLLTGDVEARLAQGAITQENAGRLRDFLRISGQALVDLGPDLIEVFVPGASLATRAGTFVAGKALSRGEARGISWLDRLEELTSQKAARGGGTDLQQSRLFEQYTDVLQALAAQRPLMVVVDDLQWADAASISLLFHLGRRMGESPILVVGAYRPADVALGRVGKRHPLEGVVNELKRYFGDIWVHLSQAAVDEGRQFVDALLDTEPNRLDEGFRQALFRHTDGHPLFTIELLRAMQERGDLVQDEEGRWIEGPTLAWDALPARVEGVIEERIGRLEEELREALAVASVEGENFTAQVVARVQEVGERQLARRLTQQLDRRHRLVWERGIERVGRQRLSLYRFRHNLFQRYLYNRLGQMERELLHEDVGRVLEELYADQTEEIAVQLARHFQEAGIAQKAVDYLIQAGKRAVRLSAAEEAIAHLTQGLGLLKTLPDSPERAQQELALQITLGPALIATKGYAAPEVEQAYTRAQELWPQVGETPQLFAVLRGLWEYYEVRAELQTAHEVAEQLLNLAQNEQDPALLLEAHRALGPTLLWLGEFAPARAHLEQGIALYDPQQHHSHAFLYGTDPGGACLRHAPYPLWSLGYPNQALDRSREALILAQELSHPHSLAAALGLATFIHQFRREVQATQERAEAAIALSAEQGFAYWLALATIMRGWALVEQEQVEEGVAQILRGLDAWRATGAGLPQTYYLALLAEGYAKAGQPGEGLTVLAKALKVANNTGERWCEAELHRLRGELLLAQGDDVVAETGFHKAIEVARRQEAKSWELRATVSLCRLLQRQVRGGEGDVPSLVPSSSRGLSKGRQMLADIYGWFTEGFDTADLQEAKALLEELSE
ncbi:MAG: AAA family ATPase, partial [Anaerolineae bacterium]